MWNGCEGEEAVIEERAFEEEVDEGIEEVPDEKDAEFGRCRGM